MRSAGRVAEGFSSRFVDLVFLLSIVMEPETSTATAGRPLGNAKVRPSPTRGDCSVAGGTRQGRHTTTPGLTGVFAGTRRQELGFEQGSAAAPPHAAVTNAQAQQPGRQGRRPRDRELNMLRSGGDGRRLGAVHGLDKSSKDTVSALATAATGSSAGPMAAGAVAVIGNANGREPTLARGARLPPIWPCP